LAILINVFGFSFLEDRINSEQVEMLDIYKVLLMKHSKHWGKGL